MVLLTYKKYTNRLRSLDLRRHKIRKQPPGRGLQFQSYHQLLILIISATSYRDNAIGSSPRSRELDDVRKLKDLLG
jgi:hypothetical protein